MIRWITLVGLAASPLAAQPAPAKPLGAWDIEYERTSARPHGEVERRIERARLSLRSAGDSVLGELAWGDSASKDRAMLRGTAKTGTWTVYVEAANPVGLAVLLVPVEAAMEWLKETIHGMQPVVVRFDLTARGDSLTGTRTVTGGLPGATARTSSVKGRRRP